MDMGILRRQRYAFRSKHLYGVVAMAGVDDPVAPGIAHPDDVHRDARFSEKLTNSGRMPISSFSPAGLWAIANAGSQPHFLRTPACSVLQHTHGRTFMPGDPMK